MLLDLFWLDTSMELVVLGWGVGEILDVGLAFYSSVWYLS